MKIQFDKPPGSAQETNGLSVRYAAAKRKVPRWRWYLLLAMVLTPPGYLLTRFMVAYWWETAPAVVITEQVVVRAREAGRVTHIVEMGAVVRAGQPVIAVETATGTTQAPSSTSAPTPTSNTSRTSIDAFVSRQATLDEALRLAQSQLALQQEHLRTMQALRAQGAATRQEVDNAHTQELQARANVNRAHAEASENRSLLARDRITEHAAASPPSGMALPSGDADIKAPFDVVVVRQFVHLGEWVERGTDVAVLQGPAPAMIHTYLPPDKARYAQAGRQATLRFMDGGRVRAEVVDVVAEAERTPAERTSPLTPRMPSIVARLRPVEPLPPAYRIHQLPLDVRFDWVWSWPL
ncbi:HlyD family secretion protein [Acidovorax carolinensis]|uniref:Multidrug transporter n=1 Tax=Acidovorax carolinensis TaxID=553814 RepID=A0A240TW17_9BURK|nr:HlyD family secretion protein [Acidovorax carolinensis]ART49308.1 multidrug transporter [Acidovorax carolinensis]ART54310.1 multidrug transporter [Acidovorax carolinensis]ART60062.1 multidrug transporter [Acidovorax carolinensis]